MAAHNPDMGREDTARAAIQPGWRLAASLLPNVLRVLPLFGDHQGGTAVSML